MNFIAFRLSFPLFFFRRVFDLRTWNQSIILPGRSRRSFAVHVSGETRHNYWNKNLTKLFMDFAISKTEMQNACWNYNKARTIPVPRCHGWSAQLSFRLMMMHEFYAIWKQENTSYILSLSLELCWFAVCCLIISCSFWNCNFFLFHFFIFLAYNLSSSSSVVTSKYLGCWFLAGLRLLKACQF